MPKLLSLLFLLFSFSHGAWASVRCGDLFFQPNGHSEAPSSENSIAAVLSNGGWHLDPVNNQLIGGSEQAEVSPGSISLLREFFRVFPGTLSSLELSSLTPSGMAIPDRVLQLRHQLRRQGFLSGVVATVGKIGYRWLTQDPAVEDMVVEGDLRINRSSLQVWWRGELMDGLPLMHAHMLSLLLESPDYVMSRQNFYEAAGFVGNAPKATAKLFRQIREEFVQRDSEFTSLVIEPHYIKWVPKDDGSGRHLWNADVTSLPKLEANGYQLNPSELTVKRGDYAIVMERRDFRLLYYMIHQQRVELSEYNQLTRSSINPENLRHYVSTIRSQLQELHPDHLASILTKGDGDETVYVWQSRPNGLALRFEHLPVLTSGPLQIQPANAAAYWRDQALSISPSSLRVLYHLVQQRKLSQDSFVDLSGVYFGRHSFASEMTRAVSALAQADGASDWVDSAKFADYRQMYFWKHPSEDSNLHFRLGSLHLDLAQRRVFWREQPLELDQVSFEILSVLHTNGAGRMSTEALAEQVGVAESTVNERFTRQILPLFLQQEPNFDRLRSQSGAWLWLDPSALEIFEETFVYREIETIVYEGQLHPLSSMEFALLNELLRRPEQEISMEALAESLDGAAVLDVTLAYQDLREKIGFHPALKRVSTDSSSDQVIVHGELVLDTATERMTWRGEEIFLSSLSFNILRRLVQSDERQIHKKSLAESLGVSMGDITTSLREEILPQFRDIDSEFSALRTRKLQLLWSANLRLEFRGELGFHRGLGIIKWGEKEVVLVGKPLELFLLLIDRTDYLSFEEARSLLDLEQLEEVYAFMRSLRASFVHLDSTVDFFVSLKKRGVIYQPRTDFLDLPEVSVGLLTLRPAEREVIWHDRHLSDRFTDKTLLVLYELSLAGQLSVEELRELTNAPTEAAVHQQIVRIKQALMSVTPDIDPIVNTYGGYEWGHHRLSTEDELLQYGSLQVNYARRAVYWQGLPLERFSYRSLILLRLFTQDTRAFVPYEELMEALGIKSIYLLREEVTKLRRHFLAVDPLFTGVRLQFMQGYFWSDAFSSKSSVLILGPLKIDSEKRQVYWQGEPVPLQGRQIEWLYYLVTRPGVVTSRELGYLMIQEVITEEVVQEALQQLESAFLTVDPDFSRIVTYEISDRYLWQRDTLDGALITYDSTDQGTVIGFEDVTMDRERLAVHFAGQWIYPPKGHFNMLWHFLSKPYQLIGHDEVMKAVNEGETRFYGIDGEDTSEAARTRIKLLRDFIEKHTGRKFQYIQTVTGFGAYRFIPEGYHFTEAELSGWRHTGSLSVLDEHKIVAWQGVYIRLSPRDYKMLQILTKYEQEGVSKEALARALWSGSDVTAVGAAIARIRRQFEAIDPHFEAIRTWRNEGYFWRE